VAFICAEPEVLVSYDIDVRCRPVYSFLKPYADALNVSFKLILADTGLISAEPTDMLFIDTWHNAVHIEKELRLSGNAARKFLVFHDTVTFGKIGEKGGEGIRRPIEEFVVANPHWSLLREFKNNNGLLVLERK
jgi:hypothetical protein